MGSASSSTSHLDIQYHNKTNTISTKPEDNAEETADYSERSRSSENENGGKSDVDNISVDSKDSNDTIALSAKMSTYRLDEKVDDMVAHQDHDENVPKPAENGTEENYDSFDVNGLSHDDDVIKQIAEENFTDPNKDFYELDTIGYYIACDVSKENNDDHNDEDVERMKRIENIMFEKVTESKQMRDEMKTIEDRYEMVQKIYGASRPKSRKMSSVANKQTLILAKIGTQFRYVAVPAYLPGQKLYKSRTFARPYIERAEGLYKVKRIKEAEALPEIKDENNKTEPGNRGQGKKFSKDFKTTKLPACSSAKTKPTFYVGNGNGVSLVEGPLTNLGWKRITDKYDQRFKLKWVQCKATINYGSFKEGDQLVNHLPNSDMLTNKLGLLNSLQEYERATLTTKGRLPRLKMTDFHPETYKLDVKSDRELFIQTYKENELWICKPVGLNQGKGIFLIRSREELDKTLEEHDQKKQQPIKPGRPLMNRIVQRYITNPLLLEGRKFDIRAYMLVASTVPFLILFHQGYVRLCCHKYEPDNTDLGRHLTNQFVQKKDPSYEKLKESTAWSMERFNEYINENVRPDCPVEIEENWVFNTFTRQMQKIMIHCFNSVKHKLQSRIGYFDLFGLDFMVDTNMKVSLIEINTNPALSCNCEALKEVIPGVVEETIYLAIECFEKTKKRQPLLPLNSLNNFVVLYCGSPHNSAGTQRKTNTTGSRENNTTEKPKPAFKSMYRYRRESLPPKQDPNRSNHDLDQRQKSEKSDPQSNKSDTAQNKMNTSVKNGKVDKNQNISNIDKMKLEKGEDVHEEANNCDKTVESGKDKKKTENDENEKSREIVAQQQVNDSVHATSVTKHTGLNGGELQALPVNEQNVESSTKQKSNGRARLERGN